MSYASHTHQWEGTEEGPILEDGAAIFVEECTWAEVRSSHHSEKHDEVFYDEGPTCGETRTKRLDAAYVWIGGEGHPVPEHGRKWTPGIIEAMEKVESAYFSEKAEVEFIDIEPESEVRVQFENIEVLYQR